LNPGWESELPFIFICPLRRKRSSKHNFLTLRIQAGSHAAGTEYKGTRLVYAKDDFLKQFEDFSPDIVLSDYSMSHFNGMDVLEVVKERYPSLPFIILTGSINEATAVDMDNVEPHASFNNWAIPSLYSIKAGTRRIDESEKSSVSDVTITEKGAPSFSDTDRIKRVSLDLKRPVLHTTGNTTSCT